MGRLLRTVALTGGLYLLFAPPASAQSTSGGTNPPNATGECTASAVLEDGTTIDPYQSSGIFTIPLAGSASYEGSVSGATPPRPIAGAVEIVTPPGLPNISVSDQWTWDDPAATDVSKSGTVSWDLPSFLPRGVAIKVEGYHQENGVTVCEGWVEVQLDGGPFDSPVAPVAIAGTAVTGAGLAFAARARGVKGVAK